MVGIGGLFRFFGGAVFIVLKFFMGRMFKGWLGLIIKAIIGIGLAIGASFVSGFCAPLAIILVGAAIILGGIFGIGVLMLSQNLPFIGDMMVAVLEPFSGIMIILLILAVVEFILTILSVFAFIPVIGWVAPIAAIVIALVSLWLMWAPFGEAFSNLPNCIGLSDSTKTGAIPGTGGISIGTGK